MEMSTSAAVSNTRTDRACSFIVSLSKAACSSSEPR